MTTEQLKFNIFDYEKYDNILQYSSFRYSNILPKRHNQKWSIFEEFALTERYLENKSITHCALLHKRTYNAIYSKLKQNKLIGKT